MRAKGLVAALLAVGAPLGLGVGAFLMGISTLSLSQRLALPGGLMVVCILPLLLFWKERAGSDIRRQEVSKVVIEAKVSEAVVAEDRWRDFWRIWWSRFFVQIAFSVCQSDLWLFLSRARQLADVGSGLPAETVAGRLLLVSTSLSLLVAVLIGAVTDRFGRRKLFVVAAGFFVAAGMGLMAAQPTLTGFVLGQLLYGVGVGLYSSAEVALAAELLPTRLHAARDLAVLNIGNAVPQAIAPALALAIIGNYGRAIPFCLGQVVSRRSWAADCGSDSHGEIAVGITASGRVRSNCNTSRAGIEQAVESIRKITRLTCCMPCWIKIGSASNVIDGRLYQGNPGR